MERTSARLGKSSYLYVQTSALQPSLHIFIGAPLVRFARLDYLNNPPPQRFSHPFDLQYHRQHTHRLASLAASYHCFTPFRIESFSLVDKSGDRQRINPSSPFPNAKEGARTHTFRNGD